MNKAQIKILEVVSPYVMSAMEMPEYLDRLKAAEEILEDYFNEGAIDKTELVELAQALAK